MEKFCGNCGARLDKDARVCGQCGTPFDGNLPKVAGLNSQDVEKKKKIKKGIKLVAVLVVIVIFIAGSIKVVSNFIGARGLTNKVMKAYKKYDIDTIVSLSSDVYYYSDSESYVEDYFEYSIGNGLDNFESSVGHNYKINYKIEEVYKLSERKQDEILDNLEVSYSDFDISLIKDISVAEVSVTARQGNQSVERNVKITMTKEGSGWKVLYIE